LNSYLYACFRPTIGQFTTKNAAGQFIVNQEKRSKAYIQHRGLSVNCYRKIGYFVNVWVKPLYFYHFIFI